MAPPHAGPAEVSPRKELVAAPPGAPKPQLAVKGAPTAAAQPPVGEGDAVSDAVAAGVPPDDCVPLGVRLPVALCVGVSVSDAVPLGVTGLADPVGLPLDERVSVVPELPLAVTEGARDADPVVDGVADGVAPHDREAEGVTVALDDDVAVPLGEDDGGAYTQLRLNRPLTPPYPPTSTYTKRGGATSVSALCGAHVPAGASSL